MPRSGRRGADKSYGLEDYLLPPRICATCGKPTSGGRSSSSPGEWHDYCRRDAKGNLLTREESAA
jgi:hypothetical protein